MSVGMYVGRGRSGCGSIVIYVGVNWLMRLTQAGNPNNYN